jgi:hypothetical protein
MKERKDSSKNILKIIGNAIMNEILRNGDKMKVSQYCNHFKVETDQFYQWLKEENYPTRSFNFESFRGIFLEPKPDDDYKNEKKVLRAIFLWFLENKVYDNLIFEKRFEVGKKTYLEKIPRLLLRLGNPETFYSLN